MARLEKVTVERKPITEHERRAARADAVLDELDLRHQRASTSPDRCQGIRVEVGPERERPPASHDHGVRGKPYGGPVLKTEENSEVRGVGYTVIKPSLPGRSRLR